MTLRSRSSMQPLAPAIIAMALCSASLHGGDDVEMDMTTTDLEPFIGTGTIDAVVSMIGGLSLSGTTSSTQTIEDFLGSGRLTLTYTFIDENSAKLFGGGDDATRCNGCQEQSLGPGKIGAPRSDHHGRWPDDKDQGGQEQQTPRSPIIRVPQRQSGSKNDKERRDQKNPEILLEFHDVLDAHESLTCQGRAHHGHREKPRFCLEVISSGKCENDDPKHHGISQVVGNPVSL